MEKRKTSSSWLILRRIINSHENKDPPIFHSGNFREKLGTWVQSYPGPKGMFAYIFACQHRVMFSLHHECSRWRLNITFAPLLQEFVLSAPTRMKYISKYRITQGYPQSTLDRHRYVGWILSNLYIPMYRGWHGLYSMTVFGLYIVYTVNPSILTHGKCMQL